MTAVLTATDALRRDKIMGSLDDNQINYSTAPTDWRAKYHEVADMLAETRAELDDFQLSSKELEEELVKELDHTEKVQQDLKRKVAKAETERDEWKSKFMTLQTTHNTTSTSLQRELDTLRQDHQKIKIQLRELEMGNDDLERNERAVSSSLADVEAKYSRALEEKILLEHELLDKANLEEETQRLKDELRDATVEISILKDRILTQAVAPAPSSNIETPPSSAPSSLFPRMSTSSSEDDLLSTPPPPDLQLSEISPTAEPENIIPVSNTTPRQNKGQSTLLQRAGFQPFKSNLATPNGSPASALGRSSTLPSLLSHTRMQPPRTPPITRPAANRNVSTATTASTSTITGTTSKSKGVQMVSEMRQRVRNLEQRIHTRVPRLRMGSITGRPNANAQAISNMMSSPAPSSRTPSTKSSKSSASEDRVFNILQHRRSNDSRRSAESEKEQKTTPVADRSGSGWVLIMEDSPSPVKDKAKEKRRLSSPSGPTAFRNLESVSPPLNGLSALNGSAMNTGLRRPQSRLSGASLSTTATTSSVPTPTSRPTTPTFLPVPSAGLYAHPSTAGATGLKRVAPASSYGQAKRSSLGSSTAIPPSEGTFSHRERPMTLPARPASGTPSSGAKYDRHNEVAKALPQIPGLTTNLMRPPSRLPSSTGNASLAQSRIGRPTSGRRSAGGDGDGGFLNAGKDWSDKGRARSGSANALNRFG